MITEKQLERIRLLSDETLYKEAIDLMHSIGTANSLPPTQINGLLNVALANTYNHLLKFVEHQRDRTTWNRREQRYLPDFYLKLFNKLQSLERQHLPFITQQDKPAPKDVEGIKMLLAREFIQHLLAENGYMALQARQNPIERNQGRPQGARTNKGGGYPR
jgi:hypothetical protein